MIERRSLIFAATAAVLFAQPGAAQQPATLNVVTAGDQNMVDYVKDYLAPIFEKDHPGVTVRSVGTGPGDAGSQKIYEKLEAEKANPTWDIDVAVIHQKAAGEMVPQGLLARYVPDVPTGKLVTAPAAKLALGANVDGYVMPMFNSQTAMAYNKNVVLTPGNAGTLDMLNRGEIAMGPVWVDMFYTWQADGKIPPTVKLKLIGPGMPGQPMYYVVPAKAANAKLAAEFVALATSPKVQADGIVKRFNWYPGIDAASVKSQLDDATWQKLFVDVTPEDLATKGKPFPIAPYFNDILESYERKVQ